jgi:hypothetical protein
VGLIGIWNGRFFWVEVLLEILYASALSRHAMKDIKRIMEGYVVDIYSIVIWCHIHT